MILRTLRPPATALAALLACALLMGPVNVAHAQSPACGDWTQITDHLAKEYGEVPVGVGLDSSGTRMLEVYASPTGSFTVLVTTAGGPTCMVATGEQWQTIQPKKKEGPEL